MPTNKSLPSKSHSDLAEWLAALGLEKRSSEFSKNISSALADGVLVAEVIHSVYPKMIQLHNYYETHSTQGRKTNWTLLNKKVLKHLRCEATDHEIDMFSKRQSQDEAVLFLRNLKSKLPAYEPLYLAGHFEVKAPSKRTTTGRVSRTSNDQESASESTSVSSISSASAKTSSSKQSVKVSQEPTRNRVLKSNAKSAPERRSSSIVNQKILAQRKKASDEARRRASLMTPRDMDEMYSNLSDRIRRSSVTMAQKSDELDQKSAVLDAKFAALRKQNEEDKIKTERRLSVAQHEERRVLSGSEVADVDERVFNYLEDPQRAIELKSQLKEEYRRASVALSSFQKDYGSREDIEYMENAIENGSSGYGHAKYSPYSPPTGSNAIRSASLALVESSFTDNNNNNNNNNNSHAESNSSSSSTKLKHRPSILSESFSAPLQKLKQSLHNTASVSSPPSNVAGAPPLPASSVRSPGAVSSLSGESGGDDPSLQSSMEKSDDELSSDDSDEILPPPPPKPGQKAVTHIRHYSTEHDMYYYEDINSPTTESDWTPPINGLIQCTDVASGRTFYSEPYTGKTAWNLSEL